MIVQYFSTSFQESKILRPGGEAVCLWKTDFDGAQNTLFEKWSHSGSPVVTLDDSFISFEA